MAEFDRTRFQSGRAASEPSALCPTALYLPVSSVALRLLTPFAILCLTSATTCVRAADAPQLAIYVMNADGGDLLKLIQAPGKKWHSSPTWSTDGKRVAFHAYPNEATTPDSHVFVVNDDGTNLQDLGFGCYPAWSPDNKQLLFCMADQNTEKANAGVWIMNADGKGRQWLFAGTSPVFAPDGSRILFVSAHEGNQSIYVYDMIEGNQKKILQEAYQKRPGSARWSPDSKKVAFVDERNGKAELIIIDAAGSEKEQTMRHRGLIGGPIAWAPNQRILLWSRENQPTDPQRLHSIPPEGDDAPVILSNQDVGTLNFEPDWSPDRQRIVFVSDRNK